MKDAYLSMELSNIFKTYVVNMFKHVFVVWVKFSCFAYDICHQLAINYSTDVSY